MLFKDRFSRIFIGLGVMLVVLLVYNLLMIGLAHCIFAVINGSWSLSDWVSWQKWLVAGLCITVDVVSIVFASLQK